MFDYATLLAWINEQLRNSVIEGPFEVVKDSNFWTFLRLIKCEQFICKLLLAVITNHF